LFFGFSRTVRERGKKEDIIHTDEPTTIKKQGYAAFFLSLSRAVKEKRKKKKKKKKKI